MDYFCLGGFEVGEEYTRKVMLLDCFGVVPLLLLWEQHSNRAFEGVENLLHIILDNTLGYQFSYYFIVWFNLVSSLLNPCQPNFVSFEFKEVWQMMWSYWVSL